MCTQSWDMSITCCRKRRRRRKERRRRKAGRRLKAFDQSCPPIFWIRPSLSIEAPSTFDTPLVGWLTMDHLQMLTIISIFQKLNFKYVQI